MGSLEELITRQSGVVSRQQLLDGGLVSHDVRRLLRRHELVRCCPGVYLNHTGTPSWLQRAWIGVLAVWPAALCHESALQVYGATGRGESGPIHVAIDRRRTPHPPPGVRLHALADLEGKTLWHLAPPRLRVEEAALDVASGSRDRLAAVSVLADAVQSRRTTARRIEERLEARSRIPRRQFLERALADIDSGTCSVLEHGFLTDVERPHRLPTAKRQVRDSRHGTIYRDVVYEELGRVIELDGRLFHDTARDRDRDLDRDLDVAVRGGATVRLGWGQVFRRPCLTAARVGRWLQAGGWDGAPARCRRCATG